MVIQFRSIDYFPLTFRILVLKYLCNGFVSYEQRETIIIFIEFVEYVTLLNIETAVK